MFSLNVCSDIELLLSMHSLAVPPKLTGSAICDTNILWPVPRYHIHSKRLLRRRAIHGSCKHSKAKIASWEKWIDESNPPMTMWTAIGGKARIFANAPIMAANVSAFTFSIQSTPSREERVTNIQNSNTSKASPCHKALSDLPS